MMECKIDMGRKNSPKCYIPKQDPVHDALEKNKKTMYFKVMLPNTRSKLKVVFLQMGLPSSFCCTSALPCTYASRSVLIPKKPMP